MITIADLDRWRACHRGDGKTYSDERLRRLLRGRSGWTLMEVANSRSVPAEDRVWVLLQPGVLTRTQGAEIANIWADRAVRRYALDCGIVAVEKWAVAWLDGTDRSGAAAGAAGAAARDAAGAAAGGAAGAAGDAAWAAGDAAWAAARAAWAAAGAAAGDAARAAWAAAGAAWAAAGAAAGAAGAAAGAAAWDAGAAAGDAEWKRQLADIRRIIGET